MDKESLKFLKTLNILYVEDEDNIRNNITRTLLLMVNKVFSCSNGLEALDVLKENVIDIVLSDINMPKMDGLELSSEIRKNNKTLPIILLTAHTDTNFLLQATKLKLIDYIVKPLDFNQLKDALLRASEEVDEKKYSIHFKDNIYYSIKEKKLYNNILEEKITAKEIALLEFLYKNKNRVVSSDEIKNNIWEDSFEGTDSALKAVLNKLRKKIGKDSVRNVSGVGYQLIVQ